MSARPSVTPPVAAPAAPVRTSWTAVGVTVLAGLAVAFQVGKLVTALPAVSADLGFGLTVGGAVLGAFTAVSAVSGAALGTLVGRVGAARTVAAGLALVAAGSALGGLTVDGAQLLVTTAIEGAGYVAVVVAAPTLIARATAPRDAGLALGIWGTYMPGGQAIMTVAASAVLAAWSWRGVWFANAALLAACAAVAWLVLARGATGPRETPEPPAAPESPEPPETRESPAPPRRDLLAALRTPASRVLSLAFGLHSLQFIAVTGFLPSIYAARGVGTGTAATLTGVVVAVNVLGNLVAGVLVRRGVAHWALIAAASATTGATAVLVFAVELPFALTYACTLAFSLVGGLLPATVLAAVPTLVPDRLVAVTNGLIVQAIGVGMVVGPVAAGALAQAAGGWHALPLVVTSAAGVVVLLAVRLRRLAQ